MSDATEIMARHERMIADGDWRGRVMASLRQAILDADPDVVEEIKWRKPSNPDGVAAYSHGKMIGTMEVYKDKVKFTFAKGSELSPPKGLSWTGAGVRRAIDIFEDDEFDLAAFGALFQEAMVAHA